jgi:hypothetical protein
LLRRTGEVEHRPDLIDGRRPWKNSGRKKDGESIEYVGLL